MSTDQNFILQSILEYLQSPSTKSDPSVDAESLDVASETLSGACKLDGTVEVTVEFIVDSL